MTTPDIYIEAVARAMCKADGLDPDSYGWSDSGPDVYPRKWRLYEAEARKFCAAYEVMQLPEVFARSNHSGPFEAEVK